MAQLTEEKLEKYLLLVSTTVTAVLVAPIIAFSWATIDPLEMELAVPESRWLFRFAFLVSIVTFLLTYQFVNKSNRKFLKVALAGFPVALLFFLLSAQFFTRWMKPLDHQHFGKLFIFTMALGIGASSISMLVGKLVTLVILQLSFSQTKLP